MALKVLVIEDDHDISHLLQLHLQDSGFEVHLSHDGTEGFGIASSSLVDLIILDLMLPGMDGLEICRKLRTLSIDIPILMLTARSAEIDRVIGLEIGADDYLTKPFSIRELLARVKALSRRLESISKRARQKEESIQAGELWIELDKRKIMKDGKAIDLTAKEFDLLVHFSKNPGRVYSRSQLLDIVWGYAHEGYEHTVNSHINRLRAKIEKDPAHPNYILTVWGVGYKFSEQEDRSKKPQNV